MARHGPLRVVIAGGGTGGHLFPGIAVARELMRREPGAAITFAGTARGIEARAVPREGFELDLIRSAGLKRQSLAAWVRGCTLLPLSAWDSARVVRRRAPDLVVGVGGYASGPVVAVAAAVGIATLVLEQNAVPGFTNRALARIVRAAAVSFDETLAYFHGKGFVSGNPVRPEFFEVDEQDHPSVATGRMGARVLIVGGSQGAHSLNAAMMAAAPSLAKIKPAVSLTHQTGEADRMAVERAYARAGLDARVVPFIDRMDRAMRAADLIVCRAGATTLAEVAAVGRPSLLVPFAAAADDHQRKNARLFVERDAAQMIEPATLSGLVLGDRIKALLGDLARCQAMGRAARQLARQDAAGMIVDRALEMAAT